MIETLSKIVQKVSSATSVEQALELIVAKVRKAMNTQVCSIYLLDEQSQRLVFMATKGLNKDAIGKVSLHIDQGLVGLVATKKELINLDNAKDHPKFKLLPDVGEEMFHSFLGVPIIHQGDLLGVLVTQQQEARQFDDTEESFLMTIAAQLATVITHAKVSSQIFANTNKADMVYKGVAGVAGVAMAKAVVSFEVNNLNDIPERTCDDTEQEIENFNQCLEQVRSDIKVLQDQLSDQLKAQDLALFDVYLQILDNQVLGQEVIAYIREGFWAPSAVSKIVNQYIKRFEQMDDAYLRERATDVKDLGQRLLAYLLPEDFSQPVYDQPIILVGEEISASKLAEVPPQYLAGLVSVVGSSHSHMSILAKAMGVPVLFGVKGLPLHKMADQLIVLDAFEQQVILQPSELMQQRYQEILEQEHLSNKCLEQFRDLPATTTDGISIDLCINTGLTQDFANANNMESVADGIGLYRSEIPFLIASQFPSEKSQCIMYQEHLQSFHPKPVTMRVLDIGGDKTLNYFPIEEENPALGWRGIRIMLDHPEIFSVQIRAMLKANIGLDNLKILLPMISSVDEFDQAKSLIEKAYTSLKKQIVQLKMPEIGIMVEVPSTVYLLPDLAKKVDFISVGSNDLTQYLLAVDRNNANVASLYNYYHPAVLRACMEISTQAKKYDLPVSICGEMAGEPMVALLLMAMGYNSLSMSANNLLKVKAMIRTVDSKQIELLLKNALSMDNARDIEDYLYRNLADKSIVPLASPNTKNYLK